MKTPYNKLAKYIQIFPVTGPRSRVGISGTTAKWRKRKFVPLSHPESFAVVASSQESQT